MNQMASSISFDFTEPKASDAAPALVPYFYIEYADGSSSQVEKSSVDDVHEEMDNYLVGVGIFKPGIVDCGLLYLEPGQTQFTCGEAVKRLPTHPCILDIESYGFEDYIAGDYKLQAMVYSMFQPIKLSARDRFINAVEEFHDTLTRPYNWPRWLRRAATVTAPVAIVAYFLAEVAAMAILNLDMLARWLSDGIEDFWNDR